MSAMSGMSDWKKFLFLLISILLGMYIFTLIGSALVLAFYGQDILSNVSQSICNSESVGAFKLLQAVQNMGTFVVPGIVLAYLFSSNPWQYIGFERARYGDLLLAIVAIIVAIPGINLLLSVNELIPLSDWMLSMEASAEMLLNAFMKDSTVGGFIVNMLIICVLAAFGEEVVFRGLMQKQFINITKSRFWGIFVSALVFSAFHLQFKGFIPRFALGMLLGYLFALSGSIWLPMVAHATNNFLSVLVFTLADKKIIGSQLEEIGTLSHYWWLGVISIALVVLLLYVLRNKQRNSFTPSGDAPA